MPAVRALTWLVLVAGGLWGPTTRPTTAPTVRPAAEKTSDSHLAAESFRHAAIEMVCSDSATPARAGRLVVLAGLADRLVPGDWRTARLLADIHLAQADPNAEAADLEAYLKVFPRDNDKYCRWVAARLGRIQTADKRAAFLQGLVDRTGLAPSLRAHAAGRLARLRNGQGRPRDALAAVEGALQLDPSSADALAIWASLKAPETEAQRLDLRLRILRGDPHAASEAWDVGLDLGALGMYDEAVAFFDHAWPGADPARVPPGNVSEQQLLVDYANALLDARKYDQAIKVLPPAVKRYARAPQLTAMLREAYLAANKDAEAKTLLDAMAKSYKDRETGGEASEAFASEVAWFYVTALPRPNQAVLYAERAIKEDPNNPVYQRILGAAELAVGRSGPDKGENRLKTLLGKDLYASVFLAERYDVVGNAPAVRKAVLAVAALPRTGPAFRRLAKLAARRSIVLPEPKGIQEAKRLLGAFDKSYLHMLHEPGRFLSVHIRPVAETVACGEPVQVVATLKNIGPVPVPLGWRGLVRPEMALTATIPDSDGISAVTVKRLPMAVWAAPRYLKSGESLRQTVRLDVGELARALALRPLSDVTLTITGTLRPPAGQAQAAPSVPQATARIRRASLLGALDPAKPGEWPKAYQLALGRIVRDLRRGSLPERMRAARRTGSLLALACQIDTGRGEVPRPLAGRVNKLVHLSLLRALLSDANPVVRQEMIAALRYATLDRVVLSLLAPSIEDPSALVRCRLVELLGTADPRGNRAVVTHLSRDRDEAVRGMAELFLTP